MLVKNSIGLRLFGMMRIYLFVISFLISLVAWSQTQGLNQFYYEEGNAISYNQKYNAAPSGSSDEAFFRNLRDQAIQRALYAIDHYSTFQGMAWYQIESFADQMNQKYNAAPSGSALERMYINVTNTSYAKFNQALHDYAYGYSINWRDIHELALQMDQKFNAAPSGSRKEQAYDQARRTLFQRLPEVLDQELQNVWNFREVESYAQFFEQKFNAASSGSLKERVYGQIFRSNYSLAQSRFSQQANSFTQQELWQIQDEYNNKFKSAPSGSVRENYFRQIRDQARSLIH